MMVQVRFAKVVIAVWVLVGLPAACESGLIEHLCHCVFGPVCEHESDCESDPCDTVTLRVENGATVGLAAPFSGAFASAADACEPAACRVAPASGLHRYNLPFPPSDRPLLI